MDSSGLNQIQGNSGAVFDRVNLTKTWHLQAHVSQWQATGKWIFFANHIDSLECAAEQPSL